MFFLFPDVVLMNFIIRVNSCPFVAVFLNPKSEPVLKPVGKIQNPQSQIKNPSIPKSLNPPIPQSPNSSIPQSPNSSIPQSPNSSIRFFLLSDLFVGFLNRFAQDIDVQRFLQVGKSAQFHAQLTVFFMTVAG